MCETANVMAKESIPFRVVLELVDTAVFTTTGRHLSNIEVVVLQGSWQGERYSQIAEQQGYTLEYLKNDIGSKLWRQLSQALGEKISKANLRAVLQQRIYQQEQKTQNIKAEALAEQSTIAHQRSLVQQDATAFHLVYTPSNPVSRVETTKPLMEVGLVRLNNSDRSLPNPVQDSSSPVIDNSSLNAVKLPQPLYHNLPPREHITLVGRDAEVKRLLEYLSFEHPTPRIGIEGIGGVGKTALVLDVAHHYWQIGREAESENISREILPKFEAIIFISAKPQHFTACGILPRFRRERTLRDIFTSIARTLKCWDTPPASLEEAWEQIHLCLAKVRTLLIIDNLDTFEERQNVLGFLYELPSTVKVVITSREPTPFTVIHLAALPQTEALNLIQQQARQKGVKLSLGKSQQLYQITGGIPAAIVYGVSQLAAGYALQDVSLCLLKSKGDFSHFYFGSVVQRLQGQPAHRLLMALAMFPKPPIREAVCAVASVNDPIAAAEGLVQLQQLSLIQHQQRRYTLLPLARSCILAQLAANSEFECLARNRWVDWYLSFVREHGGEDCNGWDDYQPLGQEWENIINVMDWCIARDRYTDACQLWRDVKYYIYSPAHQRDRLTNWETPLIWLDWLIQAAQTREDWSTAAEMMDYRAGKLAQQLLRERRRLAEDNQHGAVEDM